MNDAISSSSDPAQLGAVLEELALAGGREQISALALKSRITEEEVWRLLDAPDTRILIVLDDSARTAALYHAAVREVILSQRILPSGFRLADLKFGAEEAERDELLDESFVRRRGMGAIFDQHDPSSSETAVRVKAPFSGSWLQAPRLPTSTCAARSTQSRIRATCCAAS